MTVTINTPTTPGNPPHSFYEDTETIAPDVTFNTSYYADAHGKTPHVNTVGTWSFLPPSHLGKRPYQFVDMSFSAAKKGCVKAIGDRPAYGEFVLTP